MQSLLISLAQNVTVRNLTFQHSPAMHLKFVQSSLVEVKDLTITNPEYSPYTDGVNVALSQHVVIRDSNIASGFYHNP